MLLTANYNLKKPEGTDTVNIDDLNENADIIDGKLKNLYDTKAPKYTATASKDGLMSKTDKAKIDGIELGANAYVHPDSHPANMIIEDSTHRFLTDEEKKLIKAWEEFKASGGTIGGPIGTNRVERVIPVNTIEDGYAVALALKSANGLDKLELLLGKDSGKKALYPIQRFGLGTPNFAFSEAWFGDFSKDENGFLPLGNGYYLQFGRFPMAAIGTGGATSSEVMLRVPFANAILGGSCNVIYNITTNSMAEIEHMITNWTPLDRQRIRLTITDSAARLKASYAFQIYYMILGC